ncbi:hypothetical protein [Nonomuraea dietziae]|uniref:hypothetical protein n=1 Tax=Nonomuraea dietziae TaxID=65515 RepID=UPI0031D17C2A
MLATAAAACGDRHACAWSTHADDVPLSFDLPWLHEGIDDGAGGRPQARVTNRERRSTLAALAERAAAPSRASTTSCCSGAGRLGLRGDGCGGKLHYEAAVGSDGEIGYLRFLGWPLAEDSGSVQGAVAVAGGGLQSLVSAEAVADSPGVTGL